jgi:hypothetical protein
VVSGSSDRRRSARASELGEDHLAAALVFGREMTFEEVVDHANQT